MSYNHRLRKLAIKKKALANPITKSHIRISSRQSELRSHSSFVIFQMIIGSSSTEAPLVHLENHGRLFWQSLRASYDVLRDNLAAAASSATIGSAHGYSDCGGEPSSSTVYRREYVKTSASLPLFRWQNCVREPPSDFYYS